MDFGLSEEQRAIVATVRDFVRRELVPHEDLVERELGWTSYALQWLVARPSNILRACRDDQVQTYLLPTVRGERIDCLAMTEPGAGSDVRSMTSSARRA